MHLFESRTHEAPFTAGIMMMPNRPTKDGYEQQMQTNHLSHFLLTSLLMPGLDHAASAKGSARIVNHTSIARKFPPWSTLVERYLERNGCYGGDHSLACVERYQQSKLANVAFTVALQVRP
jgi:NAD(P)-dependent dehydrogenase (short-subunit alcohol dehydrogenase family)